MKLIKMIYLKDYGGKTTVYINVDKINVILESEDTKKVRVAMVNGAWYDGDETAESFLARLHSAEKE